ncbi:MAG: 6-phosphofructokinase, partial [Anaerovorax sp.]
RNRGKLHNILVIAEGVDISSQQLADTIIEKTGMDTKVVVLGYTQRGGSPTARDRILASRMGYKAIELLKAESRSKAIGIRGTEIIHCDLEQALQMKKEINQTYMELADILSI